MSKVTVFVMYNLKVAARLANRIYYLAGRDRRFRHSPQPIEVQLLDAQQPWLIDTIVERQHPWLCHSQ